MVRNTPSDDLDEIYQKVQDSHVQDGRQRTPAVEIIEEPTAFVISCDMPATEREDIRVDVSPNRVVIAARPRPALETLRPRLGATPYAAFERAIPLPCEVDPETAEARLNNGVLEVILPKRAKGGSGVYSLPSE